MSTVDENLTKPGPAPITPMTRQDFTVLVGTIEKYDALRAVEPPTIVTPTSAAEEKTRLAEIAGLREFLCNELLNRAPELLGTYNLFKTEYEPLVRAMIPVFRHTAAAVAHSGGNSPR